MTTIKIEYIDHGVNGEYGFFGKKVAGSHVAGMNDAEIEAEIKEMKGILGEHVEAVHVIEIPALAPSHRSPGPCGCACCSGGFCGGCGHAGCGGR